MIAELEKVSAANGGCITIEPVPDTAIGYIMERVDAVIVGAEGVTQQGGIVNHMGTYTMALAAKEAKKPFYVLAESYKFMQIYPLNQTDLLDDLKVSTANIHSQHFYYSIYIPTLILS
jgi:translation initiation factor eIF-2B subunit alpha